MGKLWWCLVVCGIAGACQVDHASDPASSSAGGHAGTSTAHAGATAGAGAPALNLAGNNSDPPLLPSGTAGAPDVSAVAAPVIHCHVEAAGGQNDGGAPAAGGASQGKVAPPSGGAPFDDACSPPPSVCLDDLVLVYFDQGECVAGRCEWVKQSLTCRNACRNTGCQDSITTK
jgi:hypothetical protein